jgi:hypothetical protein
MPFDKRCSIIPRIYGFFKTLTMRNYANGSKDRANCVQKPSRAPPARLKRFFLSIIIIINTLRASPRVRGFVPNLNCHCRQKGIWKETA